MEKLKTGCKDWKQNLERFVEWLDTLVYYNYNADGSCKCRWCILNDDHRILVAKCFGYSDCCISAWSEGVDGLKDRYTKTERKRTNWMNAEMGKFAGLDEFAACMECKLKMSALLNHKKQRKKLGRVLATVVHRPWSFHESIRTPDHEGFFSQLCDIGTNDELYDFPIFLWMNPTNARGWIGEDWHLTTQGRARFYSDDESVSETLGYCTPCPPAVPVYILKILLFGALIMQM